MRILCCTDAYPPQVNGAAVVTGLTLEGLAARGWDCAVVVPENQIAGAVPDLARTTIPSLPLPLYPEVRMAVGGQWAVARVMRDFKPDLVHCPTEFVVGRLGMTAALRAGVPVVTSYHTNLARYMRDYGLSIFERYVSRALARFHRRSRRVYTPSVDALEYLRGIGVHEVEVWGRGVDLRQFTPARRRNELRRALGLDGAFAFLHVGRLAAEKDVGRVLDAFRLLRAAEPGWNVRLVVTGRGPEEKALRSRASDGVIFTGAMDRASVLPTLYASADAFVMTSTTETLGLVMLEAMASGLPVIGVPVGGVAEHLRDHDNGLAVPPGETVSFMRAMRALVCDPELRTRLALGARLTAAALDWEKEMDRLDDSYRSVLDGRGLEGAA